MLLYNKSCSFSDVGVRYILFLPFHCRLLSAVSLPVSVFLCFVYGLLTAALSLVPHYWLQKLLDNEINGELFSICCLCTYFYVCSLLIQCTTINVDSNQHCSHHRLTLHRLTYVKPIKPQRSELICTYTENKQKRRFNLQSTGFIKSLNPILTRFSKPSQDWWEGGLAAQDYFQVPLQ